MRPNRLFIFAILLILGISCKNQLPVGGDNLPFQSVIKVDTLGLTDFELVNRNEYSGNLTYLSVGVISDPAFGDFDLTAYMLPTLLGYTTTIDTIKPETAMRLRFIIADTYGDSTINVDFNLHEITQRWRGNELSYSTELTTSPNVLSSVTVDAAVDTFYVNLPLAWSQTYRNIFYQYTANTDSSLSLRDSLYKNTIYGFAMKGVNAQAIKALQSSGISLQILETDTTYNVTMNQVGIFQSKANQIDYTNSQHTVLDTFNSQFYKFDFDVQSDDSLRINGQTIGVKNLSKAEIYFYADTILTNSARSAQFRDNSTSSFIIYNSSSIDLESKIVGNFISFSSLESNGLFKVNITSLINSVVLGYELPENESFYATIRVNDGFFGNKLIYNGTSAVYKPKIIITYIEVEEK
ncbi:hypothetical protein EP331_03890 [bacterium]|nr:MAG: hypothetical protein EP331_03890 [bacterium]